MQWLCHLCDLCTPSKLSFKTILTLLKRYQHNSAVCGLWFSEVAIQRHRDWVLGMGGVKACRQGQKLRPNNKTKACHAQDFPKPARVKFKGQAIFKLSLTSHEHWLIYSNIESVEDLNPVRAPVCEIL